MKQRRWFTADEILEKWNMQPFELIKLIRDGSLQPYAKDAVKELKIEKELTGDEIRFLISKRDNPEQIPDNILERLNSNVQREQFDNDAFEKGAELYEFLSKLIFKAEDVSVCEESQGIAKIIPETETTPAPQTGNYFKQNGKHWAIKFENEFAAHVDHVDGLLYIAHLLEKPGADISDQTLYQSAKRVTLKDAIDANEMIERNLSKGFKPQPIGTDKERRICQEKYLELEGKLETASLEEQDEIKEKMDKLVPFLNMKKRNFADPNDKKAQSNVTKRIDLAYDKLKEENMPGLVTYLKDTIKTGDYGRRYVGPVNWKVEINQ